MSKEGIKGQFCLLRFPYLDSGVLSIGMGMRAWCRLERHWTNGTLVENFTVRALNVRLECSHVGVHHVAVDTAAKKMESVCLCVYHNPVVL